MRSTEGTNGGNGGMQVSDYASQEGGREGAGGRESESSTWNLGQSTEEAMTDSILRVMFVTEYLKRAMRRGGVG